MDENAIKAKFLTRLIDDKRISFGSIIANEFVVHNSAVRADLAILDRKFVGIEIKSRKDSLRRLSTQLPVYCKSFEKVILIVAAMHLDNLDRDAWPGVEIWAVDRQERLRLIRRSCRPVEPAQISHRSLLTQTEIDKFFKQIDRSDLGSMVNLKIRERAAFVQAFNARYGETSSRFWLDTHGRDILTSDLNRLSRFFNRRADAQEWQNSKAEKLSDWAAEIMSFASASFLR